MKGIIGIVLLAVIVSLISLGILTFSFSNSALSIATTAKEVEIIKAVDMLEAAKRGLPYAFNYSFSQAVYQLSKNGGFTTSGWNSIGVPSESDGPYWRTYDTVYLSQDHNFLAVAKALLIGFSKEYFQDLEKETGITVVDPEIKIEPSTAEECLFTAINGFLDYRGSFFALEDKVNLSIKVDCSMLKLLEKAKEMFVDSDEIKSEIESALPNAKTEEDLKNALSKKIQFDYGSIEIQPLKVALDSGRGAVLAKILLADSQGQFTSTIYVKTSSDYSYKPF